MLPVLQSKITSPLDNCVDTWSRRVDDNCVDTKSCRKNTNYIIKCVDLVAYNEGVDGENLYQVAVCLTSPWRVACDVTVHYQVLAVCD